MSTKLSIGLTRKVGLPEFGSVGASASIEVEVDAALLSDPAALAAKIHSLQTIVGQAVDDELTAQQRAIPRRAPETRPARPVAVAAASANGHHKERTDWGNQRARGAVAAPASGDRRSDRSDGPPRSGKGLFAWCKEQESATGFELIRHLNGWAKREGLPYKMGEWTGDEIAAGHAEAVKRLRALDSQETGYDDRDDRRN